MELEFENYPGNSLASGLEGLQLNVTDGLSKLLLDHTTYLSNLSIWEKYIVWRYTIGSASINMNLLGFGDPKNTRFWVKQFFQYYNVGSYGLNAIPYPFKQWSSYFLNPQIAMNDISISKVINAYTKALQDIILKSPTVTSPIHVYKASSAYSPILNQTSIAPNTPLAQVPFNSTTYDPQFEFASFLAPNATCCMWEILIPRGSKVLAVNPVFHAYSFEREIILPHHSTFLLQGTSEKILEYTPKEDLKLQQVQTLPFSIGEVYRPLPYQQYPIKKKPIKVIQAVFSNLYSP